MANITSQMNGTKKAKELLKQLNTLITQANENDDYRKSPKIKSISDELFNMKVGDEFINSDLTKEEKKTLTLAIILSKECR